MHAHGARRELCGRLRMRAVALHVVHLAVVARLEPAQQVLLVFAESMLGDPEGVKAQRRGQDAQLLFDGGKLDRGWHRHAHASQYNRSDATADRRCTPPHRCARSTRYAINMLEIPGYTLMKRAGEAALRYLRTRWPMAHRIVIVCGGGNNGGDGYVLARFAQAAGLTVSVLAATPVETLQGDAPPGLPGLRGQWRRGAPVCAARTCGDGEVIVDALLGTGLAERRARRVCGSDPRDERRAAAGVRARCALGTRRRPRRRVSSAAVRAESTVTFVALKTGLFVGDGPEFAGTRVLR